MGYLGNVPSTSFETVRKQVSTTNSGTTITLDFPVTNVQDILVTVDAVIQSYDNYSVSSNTLQLNGTLNNNRVEILYVGRTFGSVNAPDNSVTTAQLQNGIINNSKIASDAAIATTKLGTGAVMQVVQGVKTAFTTTNATSYSASGLKATITPSSTSSKVLVQVSLNGVDALGGTSRNASFKLYKDGSFLDWIIDGYGYSSGIRLGTVAFIKLVSPSTTSATEFEVFFAEQGGSGNTVGFNNYASSNNTSTSTITLMEIAG